MTDYYWKEAIAIALDDENISVTEEQLENIAGSIEISHENYGMAHGHDSIPNPLEYEVNSLKREQEQIQKLHESDISKIKDDYESRINRLLYRISELEDKVRGLAQ